MRYLLIVILAALQAACARGDIIATPTPNEIIKVAYIENNPAQQATWLADNDNLTIRLTKRDRYGNVISDKSIKATPNDFNWLITNLERANFTKVPSYDGPQKTNIVGQARKEYPASSKVVIISTLGSRYTYIQSNTSSIPPGIAAVGEAIPNVFKIY